MPLIDQYGRPVRRQELKRVQAEARIASVRQPWQGGVASGLTPQRLARILKAADQGNVRDYLLLAEEVEERDPHYASVLGVRKRAVSGIEPTLSPASDSPADKAVFEEVKEHIVEHPGLPDLVEDLLDGIGKGYAIVETIWNTDRTRWTPARWKHRPGQHFVWDHETGQELRLIDEGDPACGLPLHRYSYLIHVPKLKSGHPARGGLARLVLFGWMAKSYSLKDWMAFAESYGLPIRLGRYDSSATTEDVEKLYMAVANIGTDAAAVIPDSMKIEFQQVMSGAASAQVFENLCRYLDEQTSKAVLGQTMTSDNGSSQAQANVHNEVRHDISVADARQVSATIQRDLIRPFVDLNFGQQADAPIFKIVPTEAEDIDMIMRHTVALAGAGMTFIASQVRDRLGYSAPDKDDELFGGGPSVAAQARALARGKSVGHVARMRADPFDDLDEIEEALLGGWEPVMDETVGAIEAVFAEAKDLEDALQRLEQLNGLPSAKLIEVLVTGMFQARAQGDVKDG